VDAHLYTVAWTALANHREVPTVHGTTNKMFISCRRSPLWSQFSGDVWRPAVDVTAGPTNCLSIDNEQWRMNAVN